MTIARHYTMQAADGRHADLETALTALADQLRNVPGNEGVDILRDRGNERRFVFIEKWSSIEAQKSVHDHLDDNAFASITAAVDGRPEGAYFDYLRMA